MAVAECDQSMGELTTVLNPENYTITFYANGTFTVTTDCNSISSTYSQESGFPLMVEISTMAYCGNILIDQQYLMLLGNMVTTRSAW